MNASFDPAARKTALPFRGSRLLVSVLVCGASACTGEVGAPGPMIPSGGGGTSVPEPPVDPGTKGVHRLNSAEYNATVADLLGTRLAPANSSWLAGEIGGFDNVAAVLDVDEAQYQRYFDAATLIADDVFAAADLKARIISCATEDAACVQSIIARTGLRLFRRPLLPTEVNTYNKVYAAARGLGEDHEGGVKQVLRALLASAEFVYRIEVDAQPDAPDKHPLGAYELASRLSYFLWSSAPDDTLLAAAADRSLMRDDQLRATVDRMLADPVKSARLVENFAGQWLGARKLPAHAADAKAFPDWSAQLASSLTKEIYLYFAEFLNSDRPWPDFMKADFNFVDATVANLYGVPGGAQPGLQRTEIRNDRRFGFAGLAGFLALSSLGDRTSPTLRGRWILSNLLCTQPPPPLPGVPDLGASGLDPTKNVRVALEDHRTNPMCASCHALFDPFGLSLEQFDAIGRFRTRYADGTTIDPTAQRGGVTFTGLQGLADTVSADPMFSACLGEVLFKYSLGRLVTDADRPYLQAIQADWQQGTPSVRRLVHSLVLADTFRYRHGLAAAAGEARK